MKFNKLFYKLLKDWPVKILCLIFALILFQFYKKSLLDKRYFSVPVTIESNNFLPASNYPRTVKISLWGEAVSISTIHEEDVHAYLDLSQYTNAGFHRVPIKIQLTGSALNIEPLEVSVEPEDVKVNLEPSVTKRIPIILSLKGNTAENYEVSETVIDPSTVEIIGPKSVVEKIPNMMTEAILIEDRSTDFDGQATLLNINPFVSILGTGQIFYDVKINEQAITKEYNDVAVSIKNLKNELKIISNISNLKLVVHGKKKYLQTWIPSADFLRIDCSNITEAGVYDVRVRFNSNEKIDVKKVSPDIIKITVEDVDEKENEDTT